MKNMVSYQLQIQGQSNRHHLVQHGKADGGKPMIKIMKYGEVSPDEIFARVEPVVDVEAIVTDIICKAYKSAH